MTMTAPWRRLVLLLHVITSIGFVGAVAGFLALAIVGAATRDSITMRGVYIAAGIVTWDVMVPLAWATLVIGVVQSLGTPWGLVRYYWIIVKLVLTIVATGVLMLQAQTIGMVAQMAVQGDVGSLAEPRFGMILHGTGGLVVLLAATVLSVYKPRGMTQYGARALLR